MDAGKDTFLTLVSGNERRAQSIFRMICDLHGEGQLSQGCFIVVCMCKDHGPEVILVMPKDEGDHEQQIAVVLRECAIRLSLHAGRTTLDGSDYEAHEQLVRLARAQDN